MGINTIVMILIPLYGYTYGNGFFDMDCSNAVDGYYCRGDLKGYRHCHGGAAKDYNCPVDLTCVCQLKKICKVPENQICQQEETLHFDPDFFLTMRGKRKITINNTVVESKDMTYEIQQRGRHEKRRERIYIGKFGTPSERQEIVITKRDKNGILGQYVQDFKNTNQKNCEKHAIHDGFVGYESSFKYYTKQKSDFSIITDHVTYPPHYEYEEWALKIGRTAPNEEEIERYIIYRVSPGHRTLLHLVDRRFANANLLDIFPQDPNSFQQDILTETDYTVTVYFNALPIADSWFRTPDHCTDGFQ